ncbi:MAG TPA: tetratricopeptide repeat protein, partial [Blastocatellia bacterium]
AVAELNTALALQPGYIGAEADLGRALVLQGQDEAALPHLLFVLRKMPNHSAANLYVGRVLMQQGHIQEAVDYINRAVAVEPTYAEAHYFLAVALSKEGKGQEAQAEYAITTQLWPGLVEQLNSARQAANP